MNPKWPVYALMALNVANIVMGAILVTSVRQGLRFAGYAIGVSCALSFMVNLDTLRQMRAKGWIA